MHIGTPKPAPTFPNDITAVAIVSKKHGEKSSTEDYNSGKAMIGTGPCNR